VAERPEPDKDHPQNLCLDAAYTGDLALGEVLMHDYIPHIRSRGEEIVEKRKRRGGKPRRWVVERTLSWFNRYRKLPVSFEKTEESYIALLSLAAALICWRQTIVVCG
jgi:transposase